MLVRLLARAQRDVEGIHEWWRAERPGAPTAFLDELERALRLLAEQPDVAPVFTSRGERVVRRLLLQESRAHVYYVRTREDVVSVLRVWRAVRGRPPSLR